MYRRVGESESVSVSVSVSVSFLVSASWNASLSDKLLSRSQYKVYRVTLAGTYYKSTTASVTGNYNMATYTVKNIRISADILWRVFRILTDTNVYGTGSVKIRKTRHKISVDIRMFLQYTLANVTCNHNIAP